MQNIPLNLPDSGEKALFFLFLSVKAYNFSRFSAFFRHFIAH